MLKVRDVAMYLINKDSSGSIFNKSLIERNGRTFYEGNARLNKLLHLAQNIYIAKEGKKLFDADFYAYDNGAVVIDVQENYSVLLNRKYVPQNIDYSSQLFLDKIYTIFKNASLDELIELSHEDDEWISKQKYYKKSDQKMDSMANVDVYKEQYHDILTVMENM